MIYVIHLHKKIAHAQHYIGFADGDEAAVRHRFKRHKSGAGARLLRAANERRIHYEIVAIFDGDRTEERRIKNRRNHHRLCPICKKERQKKQP